MSSSPLPGTLSTRICCFAVAGLAWSPAGQLYNTTIWYFLLQCVNYPAGEIVTVYRPASSATTYDPLGVAVALNFTTRAAAGSAPPPPSSASAPTSAVSGDFPQLPRQDCHTALVQGTSCHTASGTTLAIHVSFGLFCMHTHPSELLQSLLP